MATVGFPDIGLQGFAPKLAKGEIASLAGAADDPRYFQISLPVQPGNSGGALVDARGNVVGIVAAKLGASAALAATRSGGLRGLDRLWYAFSVIEMIQQQRGAIAEACRTFGVRRLEVFGSAVQGDFNPQKSDLDFIANFLPPLHPGVADRFFGLADALEKIFSRPVDLLTDAMIRNPVLREEINHDRTLIYDHGGPEKSA